MNSDKISDIAPEIRNKLQASKTILEIFRAGKIVPREMIEVALKDLSAAEGILKNKYQDKPVIFLQKIAKAFLIKPADNSELTLIQIKVYSTQATLKALIGRGLVSSDIELLIKNLNEIEEFLYKKSGISMRDILLSLPDNPKLCKLFNALMEPVRMIHFRWSQQKTPKNPG